MADALLTVAALYGAQGILTNPIDIWKHRLQYCEWYERAETKNIKSFVARNFYRGWLANVSYNVAHPFIFCCWYETQYYDAPFVAGLQSRIAATFMCQPMEVVRKQRQSGLSAIEMFRNSGRDWYSAMWRNFTITLIKDIAFTGAWWGSLCACRTYGLTDAPTRSEVHSGLEEIRAKGFFYTLYHNLRQPIDNPWNFGVALSCASLATFVTQPLDSVQSYMICFQRLFIIDGVSKARYESMKRSFVTIATGVNEYGGKTWNIKGLYTGIVIYIL